MTEDETPFRPFETDLDRADALSTLRAAVAKADDGELFLERRRSESLTFDDGRLRGAGYDSAKGFGLRAVAGPVAGYGHSTELTAAALRRAAETARLAAAETAPRPAAAPAPTNQRLYPQESPLTALSFSAKVDLLREIDDFLRARDRRVVQVSASLSGELQEVEILRPEGESVAEARPLARLSVSVIVEKDGRRESGSAGGGGRMGYETLIAPAAWKATAVEALRIALVNLEAREAPAGVMEVALGAGWPGILLHEAIGHGLEGDFNRKKTSAFSGLMGKRVAAPGVTVVDDGTIPGRRGSLSFDDEGTPTGRTVLIEDGILTGYMQDRQNARLMGMRPTGNGRRQSFAHMPMPRMTNTVMLGGDADPGDVLAAVRDGIYAVGFGGGQVDIVNGKFVFSCTEAYRVKNGKVLHPVKGATLIGDGPTALGRVRMIGNDMALDPGVGTCGKNGQGVPVGVGQPTLLIDGLTVGGVAA
ncbi:metalloprotease TldD [Pikeienuella sp. HZG-20]|uniref:metalloprotease TldD n=1 Tax=Paludibacillus litoralis TaxID=3133267 RepID=UPI0030EEC2FC